MQRAATQTKHNEVTPKSDVPQTLADRVALVITDLKKRGNSRPRLIKSLSGTINTYFQKSLTPPEIENMLEALKQKRIIRIEGQKVSYSFPAD